MTATHASEAALDPIVDIAASGGIEYLFPTPIFWHVFKNVGALNAELCELILAQERATPSTVKSNQGGWQSTHGLLPLVGRGRRDAAPARRLGGRGRHLEIAAAPRHPRRDSTSRAGRR